ncbi:hypothetical protein K435DRAFT_676621 [Dendrothele bispora CBS 962.96]|uniref:Uncharacterized protein n=1 Tax=Dendrothele bispora (strain CBS 962.96) TaxID=1314807 RepID=A0A4S8LLH3_DENBC|nr:hypothetical protein K435DRAFT_676621 [Dendrothele bispora CBS 962.96]
MLRTSATNCVSIYQCSFCNNIKIPSEWHLRDAILQPESVYESFKIISLLKNHISIGSQLDVPHSVKRAHRTDPATNGDILLQAHHFDEAMEQMNESIQSAGQPEINHRCLKCVRTIDEKGQREYILEGSLFFG